MVRNPAAEPPATVEDSTVVVTRVPSETQLRTIESWDDAVALMQEVAGGIVSARDEVGDGFDFLENKDSLLGIPLLFVRWEPTHSQSFKDDDGNPLRTVQCWVVANRNGNVRKFRFVDFSTGVCQQLWEYTERTQRRSGLVAPFGLRKSEFTYRAEDSRTESLAATYYIDLRNES